ncbi:Di-sulfide bridge nucleocytoplasmic transport domain-containing protein [Thamnidium elegans]|nr:Di-sulfide bridge nucleocytoplasmic transport domain-containing protein [Thamnidium elegans]
MDYEYEDSMEYEYTNRPKYFTPGVFPNPEQKYVPPPEGMFHIPESFFQAMHSKTTAVTNAICDKLNGFSLDDSISLEENEKPSMRELNVKQETKSEEKSALVLFSPPLTPQENMEIPTNNEAPLNQEPYYKPSIPVEQKQIPITPVASPTLFNLPLQPPISHNNNMHFHYQYPSAPDPVAESHSTIYYITGLFKILTAAILFTGVLYISYHIGINFSHDMHNKIAKYESVLLDEKMFCQQQYIDNKCLPNTRLPAIIDYCRNWEKCIHEPISISKSKVLAETFAEMVNEFSNSLSLKTMVRKEKEKQICVWK